MNANSTSHCSLSMMLLVLTTKPKRRGRQGRSSRSCINELYSYISEVKDSTEAILREMPYEMLKQRISPERREILQKMNVVSNDENAVWLIDYWCGKDIRGLIQMPFSRHWIMHIEASLRIENKIRK